MINFDKIGIKQGPEFKVRDTMHTHEVKLVEYHDQHWILKHMNQVSPVNHKNPLDSLLIELVSQNFYRLLLPYHPEYRLLKSEEVPEGEYYLLSQYQRGFQRIPYKMADAFESGRYLGLGQVVLIALFLEETDLKNGNVGIVPIDEFKARIVKLDGDFSLASFRPYAQLHEEYFTSQKIDLLPFPLQSKAYTWFDLIDEYTANFESKLFNQGLNEHELIREEINEAILKILILPEEVLNLFLERTIPKIHLAQLEPLLGYFKQRQKGLLQAALKNTSFLTYLYSAKASDLVEQFGLYLKTYQQDDEMVFLDEIELAQRLTNLQALNGLYADIMKDEAKLNYYDKLFIKQQLDLSLAHDFNPEFFAQSLHDFSVWQLDFNQKTESISIDCRKKIIRLIYDAFSTEILKSSPEVVLIDKLTIDISEQLEKLSKQGDVVVHELRLSLDEAKTSDDLIKLYAEILFLNKQEMALFFLMSTKFRILDCGDAYIEKSKDYLIQAYLQSSLSFRKMFTESEIFIHYLKLLVNHYIAEIKELEGDFLYRELKNMIESYDTDSIESNLLILNDLIDFKTMVESPLVCEFRARLATSPNEKIKGIYFGLNFFARNEIYQKLDQDGLEVCLAHLRVNKP